MRLGRLHLVVEWRDRPGELVVVEPVLRHVEGGAADAGVRSTASRRTHKGRRAEAASRRKDEDTSARHGSLDS